MWLLPLSPSLISSHSPFPITQYFLATLLSFSAPWLKQQILIECQSYTRRCSECSVYMTSFHPHNNLGGKDSYKMPILQMKKLVRNRLNNLAKNIQLFKRLNWYSTPGNLVPESMLIIPTPSCLPHEPSKLFLSSEHKRILYPDPYEGPVNLSHSLVHPWYQVQHLRQSRQWVSIPKMNSLCLNTDGLTDDT